MKLEFFVRDLRMTRKGLEPLVGDTSGYYTFTIAFDRAWDGLVKVVVFQNGDQTAQMIYKGESRLPPQVSGAGELYVACHGYRREGDQVAVLRTLRMVKPVRLRPSGPMEGDTAQIGTPSLYAQVMGAVGQAEAIRQELIEARDSGAFIGPPGQPGRDAEVPEVLPNPYPLYLDIGGATAEYDGSEAIMLKYTPPIDTSGTTMLKMLQEHNESEEAHPDIRNLIPDWAKAPEKPTYTAAEVGADAAGAAEAAVAAHDSSGTAHQDIRDAIPTVPAALPNPNKLTFTGAVSAEYDGSSAVKVNIPAGGGGGGTDLSLGISGASAGQIAKITTVDAEGKPTAWEAAEPASGGSREPELLYSETVENVSSLEHEIDFNGYQNFTIIVGAERADSAISIKSGTLSFNGRAYCFAYFTTLASQGNSDNAADVTAHTLTRIGPDHFKVDYSRRTNRDNIFDTMLQASSSVHATPRIVYLRGSSDTKFSKIAISLSGTTPKLSVEVYGF